MLNLCINTYFAYKIYGWPMDASKVDKTWHKQMTDFEKYRVIINQNVNTCYTSVSAVCN